jgi:FixJ family two-component response regulator
MPRAPKYRQVITVADAQFAARCLRGHVVVVDDDVEILSALSALFELEGYACETHPSALSYLQALDGAASRFPGPCCILSDVKMPDLGGLQLQILLAERDDTPLLLMSGASSVEDAVRAFQFGVQDFLVKPIDADLLLDTVKKALAVSAQRQLQRERKTHLTGRIAELTGRERDVARRVAAGMSNPAIAEELGIALRTVKLHRQRAMEKLGADSTANLVRIVDEGGL